MEDLSRATLAALGREYMLFGHLLNRAALPRVHVQLGGQAREAVAIEEWMGASPNNTRRMQLKMFPPDGRGAGDDFITGLPDDPEFIHHVPKTASPEGKP